MEKILKTLLLLVLITILCNNVFAQNSTLSMQTGHSSGCRVEFISNDNRLLISSDESQFYLWDINLGRQLAAFSKKYTDQFEKMKSDLNSLITKNEVNIAIQDIKYPRIEYDGFWIRGIDKTNNNQVYKKVSLYMEYGFTSVASSESNNLLIAGNEDSFIYVYNLKKGNLVKKLKDHDASIVNILLSPDNSVFASGSEDRSVIIWDSKTLKPLKRLSGRIFRKTCLTFSNDGNFLFIGDELGGITKLGMDLSKMKITYRQVHYGKLNDILEFDNQNIATCGDDNRIRITDPETLQEKSQYVFYSKPSAKNARTFRALRNGYTVKLYSWADTISRSGNMIRAQGKYDKFSLLEFSFRKGKEFSRDFAVNTGLSDYYPRPEENYLSSYRIDNERLVHIRTDKSEIFLTGHSGRITDFSINPAKELIATSSIDGSVKLWDLKTDSLLVTIVSSVDGQLFITPQQFYMGDRSVFDKIGFRVGYRLYPTEQFDMKFNRPDMVLKSFRDYDKNLAGMYHLAYLKRLEKMGFSEEMFNEDFHLPEISILNAADIPLKTTQPVTMLSVKASDTKYGVERINIWVNDVPLLGTMGFMAGKGNLAEKPYDFNIPLSTGKNKIQISCLNDKGVESMKETLEVEYAVPPVKPRLFFVAIGVDIFRDSKMNLTYSVKDGRDLANMYKNYKGLYSEIIIDTLFNERVTADNVLAVKEHLNSSNVDDIVILFVSGHGLLDSKYDFYFGTHDIDFSNPQIGGLSYNLLEGLLDGIPARKKLFMMDSCHSGEVDKDNIFAAANVKTDNNIVMRGIATTRGGSGGNLGFQYNLDLMKELFSDLRRGSGTMVISSAGGQQFAFEGDQWKNGVFTYSLMQGLRKGSADLNSDGIITVSECQKYVTGTVASLTKGMQKPTFRQENIALDFKIW